MNPARKRPLEVVDRPMRTAQQASCDRFMRAIGEDGGHLTDRSSPHVMWLARQLARG